VRVAKRILTNAGLDCRVGGGFRIYGDKGLRDLFELVRIGKARHVSWTVDRRGLQAQGLFEIALGKLVAPMGCPM